MKPLPRAVAARVDSCYDPVTLILLTKYILNVKGVRISYTNANSIDSVRRCIPIYLGRSTRRESERVMISLYTI